PPPHQHQAQPTSLPPAGPAPPTPLPLRHKAQAPLLHQHQPRPPQPAAPVAPPVSLLEAPHRPQPRLQQQKPPLWQQRLQRQALLRPPSPSPQ
ncbi:PREDICTED: vegetative cell wall protein gp1-like, partial [Tauraco erythrolophus]|uniref:vegetative cell wall protein gp1-like n=1 Tax=Tauraco erythrolophus TaxID=121530 RepID=UPI000523137B